MTLDTKKTEYGICSFSGFEAIENLLMWGYYANGFKGVAIEIEVDEQNVEKVNYVEDLADISKERVGNTTNNIVKKILTTKLNCWKHEEEYRFLIKCLDNFNENESGIEKKIEKITAIYFGDPFGNTENAKKIVNGSKSLRKYKKYRERLETLADEKGIPCSTIKIKENIRKYYSVETITGNNRQRVK
ncbi:MAG: hypothetical protein DRP56_09310 [Planctomycetota bacterium]|nr:MAG: hypothetical protein DRP56_09310 [Planctomycetota bacterium]